MSKQIKKENLTQVEEAYCHYFPEEVRNELTSFAVNHPYEVETLRNKVFTIIEPAADTRKKRYFIAKLTMMKKPMQIIYYIFNSFLKAQETPAYSYDYLYKNKN